MHSLPSSRLTLHSPNELHAVYPDYMQLAESAPKCCRLSQGAVGTIEATLIKNSIICMCMCLLMYVPLRVASVNTSCGKDSVLGFVHKSMAAELSLLSSAFI